MRSNFAEPTVACADKTTRSLECSLNWVKLSSMEAREVEFGLNFKSILAIPLKLGDDGSMSRPNS